LSEKTWFQPDAKVWRSVYADSEKEIEEKRQRELAVLDFFCRHRDGLLEELGHARDFDELSALSDRVDELLSEGERQAGEFRYFESRMWTTLQLAQTRFSDKLQLTRERLAQTSPKSSSRAESKRKSDREHREEIREIYRKINDDNRKARDKAHEDFLAAHFPRLHCPCCHGQKLMAHRYCYDCRQAGKIRRCF
jgi:hypothetical protein